MPNSLQLGGAVDSGGAGCLVCCHAAALSVDVGFAAAHYYIIRCKGCHLTALHLAEGDGGHALDVFNHRRGIDLGLAVIFDVECPGEGQTYGVALVFVALGRDAGPEGAVVAGRGEAERHFRVEVHAVGEHQLGTHVADDHVLLAVSIMTLVGRQVDDGLFGQASEGVLSINHTLNSSRITSHCHAGGTEPASLLPVIALAEIDVAQVVAADEHVVGGTDHGGGEGDACQLVAVGESVGIDIFHVCRHGVVALGGTLRGTDIERGAAFGEEHTIFSLQRRVAGRYGDGGQIGAVDESITTHF